MLLAVLAGFFCACTRVTSTNLGSELIPSIDGVITKDTLLDVVTETLASTDTSRIYKRDIHLLGAISNDPLFGKTRASMFFEMKPGVYPFSIAGDKDSTVVDSAVLILSYSGVYGDSLQQIQLTISEISQSTPLVINRVYPANYPNALPINTGHSIAPPISVDIRRLGDSVKNRYEKARNQIRIRLNSAFAARLIKNYDSTNAYRNDSAFRTYFAGFAVMATPSSPANALLKIDLSDANSKLALYYSSSSTGATKRDTTVTYFRFSTTCGDANFVTRDRAGSESAARLATPITAKPDSLVYVQTTPGTYVRIKIPGLQDLSNRIIHRAELITEQVPDDANQLLEAQMRPPRYLLLSVFDSVNNRISNLPNDYIFVTSGPNIRDFGGYLTSKSVPGYDKLASYTFTITRYVQGIVTRKDTSFTLHLSAPANGSIYYRHPYPNIGPLSVVNLTPTIGNDTGDGRIRLGGGTHSRFRMRVRIVFSRI